MQKARKTGLPDDITMRHDNHYVDLIEDKLYGPRIRMISINKIDPSPNQARTELGDIEELMASIKAKGILQPIIVREKNGRYEIIAGERRCIAAKNVGLKDIPCIEMNVSDNEAMELALIENLQRKDLSVFEEADGLNALADMYGYSHKQISEKIGKARSTITEIISISKIPKEIRNMCEDFSIKSRGTIIEIAKQENEDNMYRLITEIKKRELKREDTRDLSKMIKGKEKKIDKYVYKYEEKDKSFKLKIEFKQQRVTKDEIVQILEKLIEKLKVRNF
ncbi:MAG: ParB/RepB/Spo0J family partition protein [Candidatus Aminicenantes bacterium]|nr:MAG: ParB/RepB/Spo0J family partition protein [Candidatus Aminicenantes bacterium]